MRHQMRALIVEDDEVSRLALGKVLSSYGQCEFAVNGMQAVELFEKAALAGNPYEVVFLDILIPGLGGNEVLSRIRSREEELRVPREKAVKIIMTTGVSDVDTVVDAHASGCDTYLLKPIARDVLQRELVRLQLISPVK